MSRICKYFTEWSTLSPKEVKANKELYRLITTQNFNKLCTPFKLSSLARKCEECFRSVR